MKENIKKIIAFFIATIILFVTMYSCGKVVNAEVPASQKVTSHNDSWGSYDFTYSFHSKYYKIQDATGVPTSTLLNPKYFYTDNNTTFKALSGGDLIMAILNRGIGVIIDPDSVAYFINAFFDAIGPNHFDLTNSKYAQGGLYDGNDNFLGYCLNDITGCYYDGLTIIENVTVPDESVDNVKNFFDYQNDTSPDYFTIYTFSKNYIINNLNSTAQSYNTNISNNITDEDFCIYDIIDNNNKHYLSTRANNITYYQFYNSINASYAAFIAGAGTWIDFCDYFVENNEMLASEAILKNTSLENHYIYINLYDSNNNQITSCNRYDYTSDSNVASTLTSIWLGLAGNKIILPFNKDITVYKDINIKNSMDNQLYYPEYYITDSYNNYDSSLDNSVTLAIGSINNSTQNNNNIYNDSNDSYYNYYDNGYYDNQSNITNITNITNNYYNGADNPDDPDNPDNPDNPDDPDSPVLEEILRAILRFFNAIGDIIGTILASILNLIDSVLEALAGVMENLDGMSDFFSSLFAWLPDPVPQIIGAGFGICLICGIIKFIRG